MATWTTSPITLTCVSPKATNLNALGVKLYWNKIEGQDKIKVTKAILYAQKGNGSSCIDWNAAPTYFNFNGEDFSDGGGGSSLNNYVHSGGGYQYSGAVYRRFWKTGEILATYNINKELTYTNSTLINNVKKLEFKANFFLNILKSGADHSPISVGNQSGIITLSWSEEQTVEEIIYPEFEAYLSKIENGNGNELEVYGNLLDNNNVNWNLFETTYSLYQNSLAGTPLRIFKTEDGKTGFAKEDLPLVKLLDNLAPNTLYILEAKLINKSTNEVVNTVYSYYRTVSVTSKIYRWDGTKWVPIITSNVVNSLDSEDENAAISAAQGKKIKDLVLPETLDLGKNLMGYVYGSSADKMLCIPCPELVKYWKAGYTSARIWPDGPVPSNGNVPFIFRNNNGIYYIWTFQGTLTERMLREGYIGLSIYHSQTTTPTSSLGPIDTVSYPTNYAIGTIFLSDDTISKTDPERIGDNITLTFSKEKTNLDIQTFNIAPSDE